MSAVPAAVGILVRGRRSFDLLSAADVDDQVRGWLSESHEEFAQ